MEEVERKELARLRETYDLRNAAIHGNEDEAFEGHAGGNPLRVELYAGSGFSGPWLLVELAFGEVRHVECRARPHLGQKGLVWAASDCGPGFGGEALPGHGLGGFRWRVSAVAPRCRTGCEGPGGWRDGFVQVADVVGHALTFEESCSEARGADGDFFRDAWEAALPGW